MKDRGRFFYKGARKPPEATRTFTMTKQELTPIRKTIVGVQFLFVAFGAMVLMPLLVWLDPATAMLSAGVSGAVLTVGSFSLSSIGLAAIVGIILNLILPGRHA